MISRKFIKRSFVYTIAGALPVASALLLLPFYIGYLSTAEYGALSIYLAVSILVQILATYSFDSSLYIHYHEYKKAPERLNVFVSSAFVFILITGAAIGVAAFIIGDFLLSIFFPDIQVSFYPYGTCSVGIGIGQAIFKVFSNLNQAREKAETYMWSNITMFTLIAIFTIVGLKLYPSSLVGPLVGRLMASVIMMIWCLYRVFAQFGFHFDFHWLRTSFSFNNYTFLYQIQQWVVNYFDRLLLAMFLPLHYVGIYDFGLKCMVAIEVILNSLHNSFYPKVIGQIMDQKTKESTQEINRYYYGTTSVIMLLTTVCVLAFPILIEWFVWKKAYLDSVVYLPLLASPYLFKVLRFYFVSPYGPLKKVQDLSKAYFVLSVLKVALMMVLIPNLELYGVIIASVVTTIAEVILLQYFIRNSYRFKYNKWKLIFGPFIIFAMILSLEFVVPGAYRTLLHVAYCLVCGILLFWVYRNELRLLMEKRIFKKA